MQELFITMHEKGIQKCWKIIKHEEQLGNMQENAGERHEHARKRQEHARKYNRNACERQEKGTRNA